MTSKREQEMKQKTTFKNYVVDSSPTEEFNFNFDYNSRKNLNKDLLVPEKKMKMTNKQLFERSQKTQEQVQTTSQRILDTKPKNQRFMQDLILDRNEFTKQRFPNCYSINPADLFAGKK